MSKLIDTHSHIDMDEFKDDIDLVMEKARAAGVEKIIVPSVDESSFEKVIALSDKYEEVYCALGIHPSEVLKAENEHFERILELARHKKFVAIGEVGLDYYWDKTNTKEQGIIFDRQIKIAESLNVPLLVHDREAHGDSFEHLRHVHDIPIVMHCFSGSLDFARICLSQGFYIAFGGVVTFKNSRKSQEIVREIPIDKLLLETDAPYLTPEPYRGRRNEPAYVKLVAEKIAEIRNCSYDEIAEVTTANAKRVFGF